jgi:uncharacterized protein (TIGR02300 family)
MSIKAARGTKRVCQNCNSKFYDLHRDPITCPICQAIFVQQEGKHKPAPAGNTVDDDDDDVIGKPAVDIVSLDEVAAEEEVPDLEDSELVVLEDDDTDLKDDETFIEVEEDDDGGDVSGIVGGREDDEEV